MLSACCLPKVWQTLCSKKMLLLRMNAKLSTILTLILLQAPTIAELILSLTEEANDRHWTAPRVKEGSLSEKSNK